MMCLHSQAFMTYTSPLAAARTRLSCSRLTMARAVWNPFAPPSASPTRSPLHSRAGT